MMVKPINKDKTYGLVFTGGGTKGCYEVGAWKALKELDIKICAVSGTSIGAINGAFYVQNDYELAYDIWTNIKIEDFISIEDDSPLQMFVTAVKEKGLDTTPLKKMMHQYFDEDKIRSSDIDYGLVTFSLSDLKPVMLLKSEIPKGHLIDYIMASASLPIFKPTVIEGLKFVDGAVYDNVPVPLLIKAGCKDIIIIDISGFGMDRKYTADKVGADSLHTIQSTSDLCGTLEFNQDKINHGIEMGYLDTMKAFGEMYGAKYYFSHGLDEYEKSELLHPISKDELSKIFDWIQVDSEDTKKTARYSLIKRLYEYSNDRLTTKSMIQSCIEIAAEIFEIERVKVYSGSELYEAIVANYLETKSSLDFLESRKSLLSLYKALDFNNIHKKNLVSYFISISEKNWVSKKYLLKFLPKVYITYLFFKFMRTRDSRITE
jgi:NTE family protein